MARVDGHPPARVPGHGGVHDGAAAGTPPALVHNLRYNKVLHEHVVILMVTTGPSRTCRSRSSVSVERSATASST